MRRLAEQARISERTLIRRFHAGYGCSPAAWLTLERLRLARELLETTRRPVERIARDAGFGTATSLRQAFAQHLHSTPSAYRSAWQPVTVGG
ncbi:helix-turn-helix domain-containing protein [Plantactinospora siamensis]|uniref:Helix-turn-helix domain-containing protein n=1 Tax=Plantactinospora siamensis TaxID=555372 RepID=A0ABV6NYM9_9ACTN